MTKKYTHIQELRLLHMSIAAVKQSVVAELDELQAEVEKLLPRRRQRNLTVKEMAEGLKRAMSLS